MKCGISAKQLLSGMLLGGIVLLSGCATQTERAATPRQMNTSLMQAQRDSLAVDAATAEVQVQPLQVPDAVADELLPALSSSGAMQERFDIAVNALPIREFFHTLVADTSYNVLINPEVEGSISLNLKQVTVPEVMMLLQQNYGVEYVLTDRTYQILPARLATQLFPINYLNIQRKGSSQTSITSGQISESSTGNSGQSGSQAGGKDNRSSGTVVRTDTQSDFWLELQQTLNLLVGNGEGRQVVVSPQTGMVIVKAFPKELRSVQQYLDAAQLTLHRQVILEAKILEVTLNDSFQAGINWSAIARTSNPSITATQLGSAFGSSTVVQETGGLFSLSVAWDDFSSMIDLLQKQGDVQVLSSPRVATVNNQKAVIKVGTDEFFVTNVTAESNSESDQIVPEIELTAFFSGIALDVTPQISSSGEITLHIHPTVSEVSDIQKEISVAGQQFDLPLALSSIRESDSVVKAKNGQLVVIGGLMQQKQSNADAKTPLLGDLPVVGNLFKQRNDTLRKSELVILIRPIVLDDKSIQQQVIESTGRIGVF